jgi:hypothetical protein
MNKIPQHLHRHDDCLASKGSYLACSNAFHEHNLVKIGKRRVINTFREGSAHDKPCAMFLAFGLLTLHIFIHPCIWGLEIATECDFEWRLLYTHTHNQPTHSLTHTCGSSSHNLVVGWHERMCTCDVPGQPTNMRVMGWHEHMCTRDIPGQPTNIHTYIHTHIPP